MGATAARLSLYMYETFAREGRLTDCLASSTLHCYRQRSDCKRVESNATSIHGHFSIVIINVLVCEHIVPNSKPPKKWLDLSLSSPLANSPALDDSFPT